MNKGCGILRAVLSVEEAGRLLNALPTEYAGPQLPKAEDHQADDFAALRISEGELEGKWPAGCYRIDTELANVEAAVQACTTQLSQSRPQSKLLAGPMYSFLSVSGVKAHDQDSNQ